MNFKDKVEIFRVINSYHQKKKGILSDWRMIGR